MNNQKGNIQLCWDQFQTNIKRSFQTVRFSQDFCDVTLVSEDGDLVEAHRVILTASSNFFHNILSAPTAVRHKHPFIYLDGVKSSYLNSVLDFLYCGEASVDQEELNPFLEVAKILQIKGLVETEKYKNSFKQTNEQTLNIREEKDRNIKDRTDGFELEEIDTERFENNVVSTEEETPGGTMILPFKSRQKYGKAGDEMFTEKNDEIICKVCDLVSNKRDEMRKHIKSHIKPVQDLHIKKSSRSEVWNFATKIDTHTATCTICHKQLSCKSGTTSNIQQHLTAVHGQSIGGFIQDTERSKPTLKLNLKFAVWNFATKSDGIATCNFCNKTVGAPAGSATNIRTHLKTKHRKEVTQYNLSVDESTDTDNINLE